MLRGRPFFRRHGSGLGTPGGGLPAPAATVDSPDNGFFMSGIAGTIAGTCDVGCSGVVVSSDLGTLGPAVLVGTNWTYSWTPVNGDEGVRSFTAVATRMGLPGSPSAAKTSLVLGPALGERWKSTSGVGQAANLVDTWTGMFAGHILSNTGGAARPSYIATDATLGNKPTITGDGVAQYLRTTTYGPANPTVAPSLTLIIGKQVTYTSGRRLLGGAASSQSQYVVYQNGVSPAINQFNGANGPSNTAWTLDTWKRLAAYFSGSASDFLDVGSTLGTPGSSGTGAGGGAFTLFASGLITLFSNWTAAEVVHVTRDLTAPERAAFDAYVTAEYGAGLV
jgi:hypothetical protein